MKSHKNWSIAGFCCMVLTMLSGYGIVPKKTHKYFGIGSFVCMFMAVKSGHDMIHKKKKVSKTEDAETTKEEMQVDPE